MKVGLGTWMSAPASAADHRPGQLALAGPEIALEQHDAADGEQCRQARAQRPGGSEIGQEKAAGSPLHARLPTQ